MDMEEIMHLMLTPVLADVLVQPYGGIFLVVLSVLALLRK
jgi:hypothetical protein